MNDPESTLRDPDMLMVGIALERAARQAQQLALQTRTPCYVWEDGKIVNIGAPPKAPSPPPATLDKLAMEDGD